MPSKSLFALSLARKAGALVMGFDAVKESVLKGKAYVVLCASDFSEKNRMRVERNCEGYVPVFTVPETQFDLVNVSKKPTGVFAITDPQLAKLCIKSVQIEQPTEQAATIKEERE